MLTQAQVQQFETAGYVVVEDVLDVGQLAAIQEEYAG